ncbi:MAG: inner membrane CreD family protein [Enterobacterales bacterium]|nr:inner membrane CreD family protein [Enterobacterales bacterium]
MKTKLSHQILRKSIYQVPVYSSKISIEGRFNLAPLELLKSDQNIRLLGQAILNFGVSDPRGILASPTIFAADRYQQVAPSSQLSFFSSGFHSTLKLDKIDNEFLFKTQLQLKGMSKMSFIAAAIENEVWLNSDWPHPRFFGAFLPLHREISDQGYSAQWKTGIFFNGY